ncbi:hypothetical protein ACKKBG_A25740 [Auxenochlorella protothecoides x Auxenochlorella symbiontica]
MANVQLGGVHPKGLPRSKASGAPCRPRRQACLAALPPSSDHRSNGLMTGLSAIAAALILNAAPAQAASKELSSYAQSQSYAAELQAAIAERGGSVEALKSAPKVAASAVKKAVSRAKSASKAGSKAAKEAASSAVSDTKQAVKEVTKSTSPFSLKNIRSRLFDQKQAGDVPEPDPVSSPSLLGSVPEKDAPKTEKPRSGGLLGVGSPPSPPHPTLPVAAVAKAPAPAPAALAPAAPAPAAPAAPAPAGSPAIIVPPEETQKPPMPSSTPSNNAPAAGEQRITPPDTPAKPTAAPKPSPEPAQEQAGGPSPPQSLITSSETPGSGQRTTAASPVSQALDSPPSSQAPSTPSAAPTPATGSIASAPGGFPLSAIVIGSVGVLGVAAAAFKPKGDSTDSPVATKAAPSPPSAVNGKSTADAPASKAEVVPAKEWIEAWRKRTGAK